MHMHEVSGLTGILQYDDVGLIDFLAQVKVWGSKTLMV